MSGGLFGSFSSSNSKSRSWIDPKTQAAQWGNYEGAQNLPGQYTPTDAADIARYENPYPDQVVNASMADLGHQNQLALNQVGDSASAAHAFGGSRQGVAQALTNEGFARQGGLLSAGLRAQGFNTALGAAQNENQYGFQYPLARQGLLNQTLAGITPQQFSKGKQTGYQVGYGGGGGSGGGGGPSDGDIMKFFAGLS